MSDNAAWLKMATDTINASELDGDQRKAMLDAVMEEGHRTVDPFTMDEMEERLVTVIERGELSDVVDGWAVRVNVCEARQSFGFTLEGFHEVGAGQEIHGHFGYPSPEAARHAGKESLESFLDDMRSIERERGEAGIDR